MHNEPHDLSIVFEGEAGQGIQTVTTALMPILKNVGCNVFSCTEYMSRIRGGSNTTEIRITGKKRSAYVGRIDVLFAMSPLAYDRLHDRIGSDTIVFADMEKIGGKGARRGIDIPLKKLAAEAGGAVFANTVVAGATLALLGVGLDRFAGYLKEQFGSKGEAIVTGNLRAAELGYGFLQNLSPPVSLTLPEPLTAPGHDRLLMDGNSALGIGAVMAGCNFVSSYPMSPGTGLLTFLASKSADFGIVVDQAEDEIAAINAGLGASYAGARAVVTTSGGGFDLMQEGVSLAGIIETPIVIHIGQRPGPATGLPTRTEQGDLSLVIHAGHGAFARAVFAPGTTAGIIETIQMAFILAQRFQIPVFVLTDQFLLDAVCTIEADEIKRLPTESSIVETVAGYRRFLFTDDGLSPRGVPGYGEGIVRVDSDEHDEQGLITESFDMRRRMMEKRLKRMQPLRDASLPPTPIGEVRSAKTIAVCWGSNRGVVEEALELLGDDSIAALHFTQVYPLNQEGLRLLDNRNVVVIENNATGQLADLLTIETGRQVDHRILKATGEPFTVEEIVDALKEKTHG